MAIEQYPHVEERDGTYYVQGHRIPIISLIHEWNNGEDPETIQSDFNTLSLAEVYGAISFYLDHRPTLDAHFAEIRAKEATIIAEARAHPSPFRLELERRFAAIRAREKASAP